ncbi:hypothetical protein ES332_D05G241000v1 [Gossypium tomentosum]|uniref:Uncharacterized protein n=1 Tax=Gossypium tomentosum TaxID=34277 RepID=A0A5D2KZK5_GOSTO|nr:hypothetical protein ES332_D05G241000v1 [Gossypium tomentosum]
MASKLKSMNQDIIWVALLGLVLGVLARSCVEGLQKSTEEENVRQKIDKVCSNAFRRIEDCFVTLTVKFLHFFISILHFFISRRLQLRYLPALFPAPQTMSMLFWVAFTRLISSMPDNPLQ